MQNLVSPVMLEVSRDALKLDGIILGLQKNLKAIGADAKGLRAVAAAGNASSVALEKTNLHAAALERHLAAIKTAGATRIPALVPALGGGGGGSGSGPRRYHSGFHGGNLHMGPSGIGIGSIGYGLGSGATMAAVGGAAGVLYMEKAMYESAKDLQTEVARFAALGLGEKMNAEALKFVTGMKTYGTTMAQNMALFRDAQTIFRDSGSLEHAEMVAPVLSKMLLAQNVLFGENGGDRMSKFMDMLKVIELRKGLSSPAEFLRQANMVQQVLATSGGRVDATQYLNAMKTGGTALSGMSNEALYYGAEPIIQEVGGSRFGTGIQTAYNRLMLGIGVSNTSASEMLRLGLMDPSKIELNKLGGFKRYKSGQNALVGHDVLAKDFIKFYTDIVLPIYAKAGITGEDDILRENALIFGRTGANSVFNPLQRQLPIVQKSIQTSKQAATIEEAAKISSGTAAGKEREFIAAWTDFKTQFGSVILPKITAMLTTGANLLREVNTFYGNHTEAFKNVDALSGILPWNSIPSLYRAGKESARRLFGDSVSTVDPVRGPANAGDLAQRNGVVIMNGRIVGEIISGEQAKAGHLPRYNVRTPQRSSPFPAG